MTDDYNCCAIREFCRICLDSHSLPFPCNISHSVPVTKYTMFSHIPAGFPWENPNPEFPLPMQTSTTGLRRYPTFCTKAAGACGGCDVLRCGVRRRRPAAVRRSTSRDGRPAGDGCRATCWRRAPRTEPCASAVSSSPAGTCRTCRGRLWPRSCIAPPYPARLTDSPAHHQPTNIILLIRQPIKLELISCISQRQQSFSVNFQTPP